MRNLRHVIVQTVHNFLNVPVQIANGVGLKNCIGNVFKIPLLSDDRRETNIFYCNVTRTALKTARHKIVLCVHCRGIPFTESLPTETDGRDFGGAPLNWKPVP
jgi:hypothetical protein